jgi:hydrogenase nickel incorporation protein HypA/HybF
MHELGISRNIVAIVGEAANGRRVRRVTLEIGKLSGVMSDAIAFSFDLVAHGTAVQGALLEIREIDGRARCIECGAEFALPTCLTHLAGEELNVKSMELEE